MFDYHWNIVKCSFITEEIEKCAMESRVQFCSDFRGFLYVFGLAMFDYSQVNYKLCMISHIN